MNIKITNDTTVKEIKEKFKKEFKGILSKIKIGNKTLTDETLLSKVGVSNSVIKCTKNTSVENFISHIINQCNLQVEVYIPNNHIKAPNNIQLEELQYLRGCKTTQDIYQRLTIIRNAQIKIMGFDPIEPLIDLSNLSKEDVATIAKEYCEKVKNQARYGKEGEMIEWIFKKFPNNTDINEVILKVMSLDSSYSTNLRMYSSIVGIAKNIIGIPYFDKNVMARDITLVDKICKSKEGDENEEEGGKPFSFATKYCCNHNPDYPIYDKFVAKVLSYYQDEYDFLQTGEKLSPNKLFRSYEKAYYPTVDSFMKYFHFDLSFRDLDHFLWQMGMEYFVEEKIIKIGNRYIIRKKAKAIFVYEVLHNLSVNGALHECANAHKYTYNKNMSEDEFAISLLKEKGGCVTRKEGVVGDYYIDVDNDNKKVFVYKMIHHTQKEKGSKNPIDQQIEEKKREALTDFLKNLKDSETNYEDKSIDDIEHIVGEWVSYVIKNPQDLLPCPSKPSKKINK